MDEQKQFIDIIESLKELAVTSGNMLTKKDITDAFEGMSLNDKQEEVIYSYLKANNINVEGFSGDGGIFEEQEEPVISSDEEEQHFLDMYYDELKEIKKYSPQQIYSLYGMLKEEKDDKKKKELKNELINSQLKNVINWITPLKDKGISLSDLIGEANLTLVTAVDDLVNEDIADGDGVIEFIREEVTEYVTIMANSENESLMVENIALDKVGEVNETVKKLYAKYLRDISIKEIADEMSVSEEEVRNILNMSGNKLKNIDYYQ